MEGVSTLQTLKTAREVDLRLLNKYGITAIQLDTNDRPFNGYVKEAIRQAKQARTAPNNYIRDSRQK